MRLAGAAVAPQQHVLHAREELASCQVQHQGLVGGRDGEEVEAVEALDDWELCLPDASSVARRSWSSSSSSVRRSR